MQKILITNDDGIQSDGIIRLARAAKKYGKVWVVAPDGQRSAMSHRITLRETIEFFPVDFPVEGVHAYASTGTPADCVRFGILNIVKEKPDVIIVGNGIRKQEDPKAVAAEMKKIMEKEG